MPLGNLPQRRLSRQSILSCRGGTVMHKAADCAKHILPLNLDGNTVLPKEPHYQLVHGSHPHKGKGCLQIRPHNHLCLIPQTAGSRVRAAPAKGHIPGADLLHLCQVIRL